MITEGEKWARDKLGGWDEHIHMTICKIENQ